MRVDVAVHKSPLALQLSVYGVQQGECVCHFAIECNIGSGTPDLTTVLYGNVSINMNSPAQLTEDITSYINPY